MPSPMQLRQQEKREAMRLISAAGVPAGAVLDTTELLNDTSFETRGIMQVMRHPTCGDFKMPCWPVRFSGRPLPLAPAPLLGEHTDDVLGNLLGLGADEVISIPSEEAQGLRGTLDTAIDTVGGKAQRDLFAYVRKGGTLISSVSVPDAQLAQQCGIEAKFILVDVKTEDGQSRISSTHSSSSCALGRCSR